MEPQNPTIPTPPPQVTPPAASPVFPKKNNLVVILLSVFLLITLLISGYLFLQVQSLTKQLAQSQVQVQPVPTSISTEIEKGSCEPAYEVVKTPELSAEQVYSEECLNKGSKDDCLRVDIYNLTKKDFSEPDGIPDCEWAGSN